MPFLDKGETSQVTSSYTQTLQQLEQLLEVLLKLLQSKMEKTQEENQAIDDLCAESVKTAVTQHGQEMITGSGDRLSVYATEGYTLSADLNEPTGMPVYTVSAPGKGDVLSFQEHPGGEGLVFFETESSLDETQKAEFLKALQHELSQSKEAALPSQKLKGAELVQYRLDQMGDMAPYGSKAILVADRLLQNQDTVQGNRYTFERQQDGAISISDRQSNAELFRMGRDGSIQASDAALTPQNQQNFNGMFNKLSAAQPMKAAAVKSVSSFEIGER